MELSASSHPVNDAFPNTIADQRPVTSSAPFHVMTKPIGPICNLDCKYCFYLEKETLYPGTKSWKMSDEVLESYIRQYIESQSTDSVAFAWQGGEPTLLGLEYFEKIVALQQKYADGKQIENAVQTNGVLLNEAWTQFFAANDFLIGISIDGPRELHDYYRVDKGQQPTFDKVMRGIQHLKEANVRFNTLTVVNRQNSRQPKEVYRFLKETGSGYMQFIPVVERVVQHPSPNGLTLLSPDAKSSTEVSDWSVESLEYGKFLCAIFDEWVRHDVGKTFVQIFDVALESWLGMHQSLCVFSPTCGSALALEHQGDLYSCDHYVYPENKLGNILENPLASLVQVPQQKEFGSAKRDTLPRYCRECDVRFACHGECPKHRFINTPDGEPGLNYLCAAYKLFFHHVGPYMEFMSNEFRRQQAPAKVMEYARWVDEQLAAPSKKPSRRRRS